MFAKYAIAFVAALSVAGFANAGSSHNWNSKKGKNFNGFSQNWNSNNNQNKDHGFKSGGFDWDFDWDFDFNKKNNKKDELCDLPEVDENCDFGWGWEHLTGKKGGKNTKKNKKDRGNKWCKPVQDCEPNGGPECNTVPTPSAAAAGMLGMGLLAGRRNKKNAE